MKKIYILFILCMLMFGSNVYAEELDLFIIDEQIDALNIGELEKIVEDTIKENEILPQFNVREFLINLVKGNVSLSLKDIGKGLYQIFFKEIRTSLILLAKILVITLISSILTNLQSTFENTSVSELANYISYVLIAILVISSFNQVMDLAKGTIDKMVGFMQAILPVLLTLLTAASGPNTKILFHPMIIMTVNLIGILIKTIILPLIFFSFIISIISNISSRAEFSKLSELGRQVITLIITGALTLFIGIITIYGLGTKIDGITIRTAKFAIDKFIPIVGGFLSDAVDAVVGCSAILKNGLGFIGLLVLLFICILPVIKIIVLLFTYKIITVVIQPIGSPNLVEFFNQVGKSLLLILVSLISTGTMFFITITIIVEAGNSLLMLR
ncbi:stage III sporulation protein AE [Tissierella pigra]|uniref:Stage III sporulation protein AE n=1 Tax=Tissierella pigra TaxID=2607614 RepID=A0A6N7XR65_9FIRM|nr:stage III sporulation protein AE [Tissierella pigra]MBU5426667.1 stage III sporulation protein AE [Tissierella pigra]MST99892.1 stage III sporulation protein AE [Tissierella pigra]